MLFGRAWKWLYLEWSFREPREPAEDVSPFDSKQAVIDFGKRAEAVRKARSASQGRTKPPEAV